MLLDAGANIECKPMHLAHYAIMGSIYAREILHYENPRVGILSIGTEESKGNELTLEAFRLCKQVDLNFIGNIEGHDLFRGQVDVVVVRRVRRQRRAQDLPRAWPPPCSRCSPGTGRQSAAPIGGFAGDECVSQRQTPDGPRGRRRRPFARL